MKTVLVCFVFTGFILLGLCGASCRTVPAGENNGPDAGIRNKPGGEAAIADKPGGEGNAADAGRPGPELHHDEEVPQAGSAVISQDPVEFIASLTGKDVIEVYPSTGMDRIQLLLDKVKDKETRERRYFFYNSPIRSRPPSSTDRLIDTAQAKTRALGETYTLRVNPDISADDSDAPERQTYTHAVHRGIRIMNYREEAVLRYVVRDQEGYGYGECIFASAIIVPDEEMSGAFAAVEAFPEWGGRDIPDFSGEKPDPNLKNPERR
jgi:hypothetical protein